MLGFTLPLYAFGAFEGLIATLLILPAPINKPAVQLIRLTQTRQGKSVINTITVVLLVLLLSPLYDLFSLYRSAQSPKTADASSSLTNLERREAEASAHLTGIMTASELFLMFLVQKLGLTLSRLEDVEASSSARQAQLGDAGNQDVAGVSEASQIPLPDQNLKSE